MHEITLLFTAFEVGVPLAGSTLSEGLSRPGQTEGPNTNELI